MTSIHITTKHICWNSHCNWSVFGEEMMWRPRACFWKTVILRFQIWQGNVATQLRWGKSLHPLGIENFPGHLPLKKFEKPVYIRGSYGQKSNYQSLFCEHSLEDNIECYQAVQHTTGAALCRCDFSWNTQHTKLHANLVRCLLFQLSPDIMQCCEGVSFICLSVRLSAEFNSTATGPRRATAGPGKYSRGALSQSHSDWNIPPTFDQENFLRPSPLDGPVFRHSSAGG